MVAKECILPIEHVQKHDDLQVQTNIIEASRLYVGMRGIFQDGDRFGNFQALISLLSYFLRPYNWLS